MAKKSTKRTSTGKKAAAKMKAGKSRARYPWDHWLDGKRRTLRRGRDFQVGVGSMQCMVLGYALRHKLLVKTRVQDADSVVIQFHKAR